MQLSSIVESEFGVSIPPELLPEVLSVNWLVDVIHELVSDDGDAYVM